MGAYVTKNRINQAVNKQKKAQKEQRPNQVLYVSDYKSKCQKPQEVAREKVGYIDFDANPIRENSPDDERVLIGLIPDHDGRVRVTSAQKWPYSVHGLLSMKVGDKIYTGTATMIGPNIAITAAHNVYDFEKKIEIKVSDLHFHPAADEDLLPFGVVNVISFYYPEEYKTNNKEDYAVLILEKDIGHQTGYFGINAMEASEAMNKKINITGYPADKVKGKSKCHQMWEMDGPISHLDDNLISYHQIDTFRGQSGSGIWYEEGGEYYIIGVHVQSAAASNQGIFLNKKRVQNVRDYILSYYLNMKIDNIQLQTLDLQEKNIGEKGMKYLSNANFPELRSLNLNGNKIGDEGAEYLSNVNFPQLQTLDLSRNGIGEKGAEYISKANFQQLQSLNLFYNQIGDKGVEYLIKANFSQLQSLNLSCNGIREIGAEYVSKANFSQLKSLDLGANTIGDKGAEYVSKANFPQLQSLTLHYNEIGDKGAEYLSKANFPQLKLLQLSTNQIRDQGTKYLSEANFPQLRELNLLANKIGPERAVYFSKANFPQLIEIHLSVNYD